jgi:hypothetical protein
VSSSSHSIAEKMSVLVGVSLLASKEHRKRGFCFLPGLAVFSTDLVFLRCFFAAVGCQDLGLIVGCSCRGVVLIS